MTVLCNDAVHHHGADGGLRCHRQVYKLLGAEENLRNIYRYGQHHGFDDVTTYFDWFDKAFGIKTGYHSAINSKVR